MNDKFLEEYDRLRTYSSSLISQYLLNHSSDSILDKAVAYSLNSSGKLFRPVLTFSIAEALGLAKEELFQSPLAIELFHVGSLVHDDLPSIDDDDFRRGRESLHKVFGEGVAVLVGDYLFSEGFSLVQKSMNSEASKKILECAARVLCDLNKGQILDLTSRDSAMFNSFLSSGSELEQKKLIKDLNTINILKTSSLFELCVSVPSILMKLTDTESQKLLFFATNLGLLFQVSDDILDFSNDNKESQDKEINYISILSHGGTLKLADDLFQSTSSELRSLFPEEPEFLLGLVKMARYRKG